LLVAVGAVYGSAGGDDVLRVLRWMKENSFRASERVVHIASVWFVSVLDSTETVVCLLSMLFARATESNGWRHDGICKSPYAQ
jgi:hypothetical protein